MRTVLLFTDTDDGRKVILNHSKDVTILREKRNYEAFIVVRFPIGKVNMEAFELRNHDRLGVGFDMVQTNSHIEFFFFDCITFTLNMSNLEKIGLFKVTQRRIPNHEDHYAYYMNAQGLQQWTYNGLFMTLQWLAEKAKNKRIDKKERN